MSRVYGVFKDTAVSSRIAIFFVGHVPGPSTSWKLSAFIAPPSITEKAAAWEGAVYGLVIVVERTLPTRWIAVLGPTLPCWAEFQDGELPSRLKKLLLIHWQNLFASSLARCQIAKPESPEGAVCRKG